MIDRQARRRFKLRTDKVKKWDGKVSVITGASSGIGAATAERLALGGMRLVLVARRHEQLTAVADGIRARGGHADIIAADLTVEDCREGVFNLVEDKFGGADVLVNNAGFGWYGY